MSELSEKSIQILELPQVLTMLAGCAVTEDGKEKSRTLRPMTDMDDIQRAQDETSAAVKMLILRGSPGFSGVKPVAASLQRADMGGSLSTRELTDVAAVLRAARTAGDYGASQEKSPISHLFQALTPNRFLEERITNSILGEDEIAAGVVACKDMSSGEQTKLSAAETIARIQAGLAEREKGAVILEK